MPSIAGKVALFVRIVGKVVELIALKIGRVGTSRVFFCVTAARYGGKVTEGLSGVVGYNIELTTIACIVPFFKYSGAFLKVHIFNGFGVADSHVFPITNADAPCVAKLKVKHAFFGRGLTIEVRKEALTIKFVLRIINLSEVQDSRRKVNI